MKKTNKRISKNEYYLRIAEEVSLRCSCFRAHHGAVIIKDDHIVATGYNGAPRKTKDCYERGNCLRAELGIPSGQRYEMCRSIHSEQNAIINAARAGVSLLGGSLYLFSAVFDDKGKKKTINAHPCFICKKMIINAGIEKVVVRQADGGMKEYFIEDWVQDWQKNDMIDDMEIYGTKIIKEKIK
jgi:dCMP deaminase